MFNQRQIEIVLELCENHGHYMAASYFAEKQQVSLRTIQNDMKQIKAELSGVDFLELQTVPPKGSRMEVKDLDAFSEYKDELFRQFSGGSANYQEERINQLLLLLLSQHRAISLYDIENTVFVSRSTVVNDLKRVADILQKYDLELMRGSNKVTVDGSEISKRRCLSEENLLLVNAPSLLPTEEHDLKTKLKDILVESYVSFKHMVSEVMLNNSILLLEVAVRRMREYFFIEPEDLEITEDISSERALSSEIFRRVRDEFHIRVPQAEIDYFAVYIRGRGNCAAESMISEEINDFIAPL